MEQFTKENGTLKGSGTEKACKSGLTGANMRATGNTTKPMAKEDLYTQTEKFTKETGSKTKLKDTDSTSTWTEPCMWAGGETISSMELGSRLGLTKQSTMGTMSLARSMAKGSSIELIRQFMKESLEITTYTATEPTFGAMAGSM